ncbi:haloacid dehalogenase type II [Azoarcus sp. L1K30]|uniref:haloacid dehalogenase type II n=1 Tax=Azoarcus sp. L1K30 TaxID=2820277 RepID=UPI001B826EE9|nr:haloacid dehalogenase type II [Azoarcus sp. L1K30]MBR0568918.1 haloacid dehalogenase type II [Azoarcus sp. L1K30]
MTALRLKGIEACVFDAYGTLFDISSVAEGAESALGDKAKPVLDLWRAKQLQYTWLRGLAGHHADFWQVTGEALSFALASFDLDRAELKVQLMAAYMSIQAYPEVAETLRQLKDDGMRLVILSNGSPAMLTAAVTNARLKPFFDKILSVEEVGIFKPHPLVYALPEKHLGVAAGRCCFISSNSWDAFSAKAYGYRVMWCNRFNQLPECLPTMPDGVMSSLATLPGVVLPR